MRARLRAQVWVSLFVALGLMVGCDEADPEPDAGGDAGGTRDSGPVAPDLEARKRQVLASMTDRAILPTLRDFATHASALETAAAAFAEAPESTDARTGAQMAWVTAVRTWQRLEVMQVGPAGMSGANGVTDGEDLRDEVYSWPTTSTCQIDQRTLVEAHADPAQLGEELVDSRGLDAMEYLLYRNDAENTCSPAARINSSGTWDTFSAADITARRARYAATAATLVSDQADALVARWEAEFGAAVRTAGDGSDVYSTAQAALNDLAGAMLYLDNSTRDMKLGEPAGVSGCPTDTCPEALEFADAQLSLEAIIENVRAFELLYHGGEADDAEAVGLHDLLLDLGQESLANDMAMAIEAALTALAAVPGPLATAIESDAAAVMAAYTAVGEAQRLFKVDVVTALDLEPSTPRVGDND